MPSFTPKQPPRLITALRAPFDRRGNDDLLRVIDIETGREVWQGALRAGGEATPMTYEAGGRQIVVINAGRHVFMGAPIGDDCIACALPQSSAQGLQD